MTDFILRLIGKVFIRYELYLYHKLAKCNSRINRLKSLIRFRPDMEYYRTLLNHQLEKRDWITKRLKYCSKRYESANKRQSEDSSSTNNHKS